ncbi:MAG: YbhB/YbcL family Raf kinase inhibitor-like protein [Patescibacteria group bacterium]
MTLAGTLSLSSPAFAAGGLIPVKYTCDEATSAGGVNPPLAITGVPAKTQSLVLIMDDPDAVKPAGRVWDHWIVFNLPPTITTIAENTVPAGMVGLNSGGQINYQGPCPPDREHRYFFKLYALDTALNLIAGANKKEVEQAMTGHILDQAVLIGRYERLRQK